MKERCDPFRGERFLVLWSFEDVEFVGLCREYAYVSHLAPTAQGALDGIRQLVADIESVPDCPVHKTQLDRFGCCEACERLVDRALRRLEK